MPYLTCPVCCRKVGDPDSENCVHYEQIKFLWEYSRWLTKHNQQPSADTSLSFIQQYYENNPVERMKSKLQQHIHDRIKRKRDTPITHPPR